MSDHLFANGGGAPDHVFRRNCCREGRQSYGSAGPPSARSSLKPAMRPQLLSRPLLGAPSSPHRRPPCPLGVRGCDGRGYFRALHLDRSEVRPAPQRHGQHIRARGAPPAAAAINVACSTVEPKKLLQLRHRPPVRARGTMNSNRHALRAALSRQSLANSLVCDNRLKCCHAGPEMSRARAGANDWPARLF